MTAQATAWLVQLASGEATTEHAAALQRWRNQSDAHSQAFAEAKLLWEVLGPASDVMRQRATTSAKVGAIAIRPAARLGRRAFLGGALAASVAAAGYIGSRPPFRLWPSPAELAADYRTGTGEQQTIALVDDVSVLMNTQTSIDVRSAITGPRALELIDGEAVVTTNNAAGLNIFAASGRTTASSARFGMRRDGASVCVTCLEGAVEVNLRDQTMPVPAGHQVMYDNSGLKPVSPVDIGAAMAWERGQLIFRHEPFARVIQEINRYRTGKVVLLNDKLAERDVVATLQLSRIDEAVDHLARTFDARVRRLPGRMILLT